MEEKKGSPRIARDGLLVPTVFLTGAAVLTLEILGTRLLSPHFGSNLYVWSALISVTMIALALGYWLGGKLADARGEAALLDKVIAGAAVWVAIIPSLVDVATGFVLDISYRIAILSTTLISFGPALFLLGLVTPVAVKLAVPDLDHVGRRAGMVYAASTAGGIAGALAAGFLLFPTVAVTTICYITAVVLLALAGTRWLARGRYPRLAVAPPVLLVAVSASFPGTYLPPESWDDGEFQVVSNRPSFYGPVRVLDWRGHRLLTIDGMCHSARFQEGREAALLHVHTMAALPHLRPEADRALLIGLGGGDMVRLLGDAGVRTTAIEIDPAVVDAAVDHFGLCRADCEIHVGDGRLIVNRLEGDFDFVILDAFMGGIVPAHMYSRQSFAEMKGRLRPGGVLALNVAVTGPGNRLIDDLRATLGAVFTETLVLLVKSEDSEVGNAVMFASDRPLELPRQWRPAADNPDLEAMLARLPDLILDQQGRQGTVITDERNFVEALSAPIDLVLRRSSRAVLPRSILSP